MARDKKVNVVIRAKDFATRKLDAVKKSLFSIKNVIAGGLGLAAVAIGIKKVTDAASRQEDAINLLSIALKNNNDLTQENLDLLTSRAAELQKVTRFGDEAIIELQAELATYGMNSQQVAENTKLILDLATAKKINLVTASQLVGKAFVGETGTLSRYGIIIDKNIPKTEKFAAVQSLLNKQFGGAAQAQANTFRGITAQLSNAFGDLLEVFGKIITKNETIQGLFRSITKSFATLATLVDDNRDKISGFFSSLVGFAGAFKSAISSMIPDSAIDKLKELVAQFIELFDASDKHVLLETKKDLDKVTKSLEEFTTEHRITSEIISKILKKVREQGKDTVKVLKEIKKEGTDEMRVVASMLLEQIQLRRQVNDLLKTESFTIGETTFKNKEKKQAQDEVTAAIEETTSITDEQLKGFIAAGDLMIQKDNELAEAQEKTILETARVEFENLQKRARAIQQFNQNRLNAALSIAQKEIDAQQRLVNKFADIRSASAVEQLRGDELNATERKILLQEQIDAAEVLAKKIAAPEGAQDLENNINKLEQLKESLKGIEGVEDVIDVITEGFKEAAKQVEIFGKAKFDPDIDVEAVALKMKTAGEKAFDEFKRGFLARSRANPINLDESNFNLKSSFLNNGG